MTNLITRSLSGTVYVAAIVGCLVGGTTAYCILFALFTALAIGEFCRLVNDHTDANVSHSMSLIMGVYLFVATYLYLRGAAGWSIFTPYLLSVLFILISELYLKQPNPLANWAYTFAGQVYVALPFALFNVLAYGDAQTYDWVKPLAVFVFLWLNDTGAYCFGSMLHRYIPYKLFPRVSPNKSWIGSIGGVLVVLVGAAVFAHYDKQLTLPAWLGLGAVVAAFGTWGDLVESLVKRHFSIKDSGRFLPGHGGVLDRFDSALLAIPAAVIYLASL